MTECAAETIGGVVMIVSGMGLIGFLAWLIEAGQ